MRDLEGFPCEISKTEKAKKQIERLPKNFSLWLIQDAKNHFFPRNEISTQLFTIVIYDSTLSTYVYVIIPNCGQSYKQFTLVNYDSRAVKMSHLLVITSLES